MYFCRKSSDCDLCAYKSEAGFTIDVVDHRILSDMPPQPSPDLLETEEGEREFYAMRARIHDWVETELEQIALPHAGKSFLEPSLECFRARLLELRALGYRVPNRVRKGSLFTYHRRKGQGLPIGIGSWCSTRAKASWIQSC